MVILLIWFSFPLVRVLFFGISKHQQHISSYLFIYCFYYYYYYYDVYYYAVYLFGYFIDVFGYVLVCLLFYLLVILLIWFSFPLVRVLFFGSSKRDHVCLFCYFLCYSLRSYLYLYIYIYIYPEVLKSGSALILRAGSYL